MPPQPTECDYEQYVTFPQGSTIINGYIWDSEYVKSDHNTRYVLLPIQEWEAILDLLADAA